MTDPGQMEAMKSELETVRTELASLKEIAEGDPSKMLEELRALRALATRRAWTMPKSYGMLDEAKFLEKLYEKVRFGSFELPDVAVSLLCRVV